jgi:hypothetical protein
VRTGRSEALDIFRKWLSERSLVRCDLLFGDFAASLRGRVFRVAEDRGDLVSDDTHSELALVLRPDLEFAYGEPRDFPAEAEIFAGGLVVLFPSLDPAAERDKIRFMEMLPSPSVHGG